MTLDAPWPRRGEIWDCGLGQVAVHDLYLEPLPGFMRADCIFVDPPYNAALESNYRHRVGLPRSPGYKGFLDRLFRTIGVIAPRTCFVEIGAQNVGEISRRLAAHGFARIDCFKATYYWRHPCYVVRGSAGPPPIRYDDCDESEIVALICEHEEFTVIADPCMGKGLVGRCAFAQRRRFCGTELNPERLGALIASIAEQGGSWNVSRGEPAGSQS